MMNTYYIGGSPCAGKSIVAEILSRKYNLYYFKVDDFLDGYTKSGALKGYPICKKNIELNAEQIWMREPSLQCAEEFEFYKEIFEYVLADLQKIRCENGIITEGAAYIPNLMKQIGIPGSRYISITPEKEFQISHFQKRAFVPSILEGCSDKEKAFCNWMERDVLFAGEVQKQCCENNYISIINDGSMGVDELVNRVAAHFGLADILFEGTVQIDE